MSATVDPINSYQRDDMSIRARKARSKSSNCRALPNRPDVLEPTPERLARRERASKAWLRGSIVRLRQSSECAIVSSSSPGDPHLNEMLFQAAENLEGYRGAGAGLGWRHSGTGSQPDRRRGWRRFSGRRACGSLSEGVPHGMPR